MVELSRVKQLWKVLGTVKLLPSLFLWGGVHRASRYLHVTFGDFSVANFTH